MRNLANFVSGWRTG